MLYNLNGYLRLVTIDSAESNVKPLKVIKKTIIKKGKIQLTFHDGRNIIQDKTDTKIGDVAIFDLDKKQVKKWLKIAEGMTVYLTNGSHVGNIAKIKSIIRTKDLEKTKALVTIEDKDYATLIDYAFVVGKDKPEVKLE